MIHRYMCLHAVLALVRFETIFTNKSLLISRMFIIDVPLDVVMLDNFVTKATQIPILHTTHKSLYNKCQIQFQIIYSEFYKETHLKHIPCIFLMWVCLWCLVLKGSPHISQGKCNAKWAASICFFRSVLCDAFLPHWLHS